MTRLRVFDRLLFFGEIGAQWGGFRTILEILHIVKLHCRLVGILIGGVLVNDRDFCVDFGEGFVWGGPRESDRETNGVKLG